MKLFKMTTRKLDIFLILPALAGLTMIADGPKTLHEVIALTPMIQTLLLIGGTIIAAVLAVFGSNLDRRCAEDYLFQILANAAHIAVIVTVLVNMFWLLAMLAFHLPHMTGQNLCGVLVLGWCFGYYWFRLRGVKA